MNSTARRTKSRPNPQIKDPFTIELVLGKIDELKIENKKLDEGRSTSSPYGFGKTRGEATH